MVNGYYGSAKVSVLEFKKIINKFENSDEVVKVWYEVRVFFKSMKKNPKYEKRISLNFCDGHLSLPLLLV